MTSTLMHQFFYMTVTISLNLIIYEVHSEGSHYWQGLCKIFMKGQAEGKIARIPGTGRKNKARFRAAL